MLLSRDERIKIKTNEVPTRKKRKEMKGEKGKNNFSGILPQFCDKLFSYM